MEQGIGQIAVQAGGREMSSYKAPGFNANIWEVGTLGYLPPQEHFVEGGDRNCFVRNLYPLRNSDMQTFYYKDDRFYEAGNFLGIWGAHMVDYDQWKDNGTPKPNFTFTRSLFVVGQSLDVESGEEFPIENETITSQPGFSSRALALADAVREMQQRRPLFVPLLTLRISALVANGGGLTYSFDEVESDIRNGNDHYRYIFAVGGSRDLTQFVFTLRFGNQYWQGLGWGTEPILLYEGYHNLLPKSFQNNFVGEGTYSAPINGFQTGDVELTFYGIWEPDYKQGGSPGAYTWQCVLKPRRAAILSGITLQYNPPLNLLDVGYKNTYTCSKRTAGFPEDNEKTLDLKLISDSAVKENWGWVYDSEGNKLKTLYQPQNRNSEKPERIVLNRNVAALSRNRQYATMSVECEYDHMPFRRVQFLGRTWYPLAVKTDLRTCFSEVLMFDITDIHL
jgi:hypothetical protein